MNFQNALVHQLRYPDLPSPLTSNKMALLLIDIGCDRSETRRKLTDRPHADALNNKLELFIAFFDYLIRFANLQKKPGFITSINIWERKDRDSNTANIIKKYELSAIGTIFFY